MRDDFKTWEQVKNLPHDITGIKNPESYMFELSESEGHEKVYYPRHTKRAELKALVLKHLDIDYRDMRDRVADKALNSGAIDPDNWDLNSNKMLLVHSILIAMFENAADQHKATGTSFEKQVKYDSKNISYFL